MRPYRSVFNENYISTKIIYADNTLEYLMKPNSGVFCIRKNKKENFMEFKGWCKGKLWLHFFTNLNKQYNGEFKEYYPDGSLCIHREFKNGKIVKDYLMNDLTRKI